MLLYNTSKLSNNIDLKALIKKEIIPQNKI